MAIGNTFNQTTFGYGHSKKVWREIERVYPAGGVIDSTDLEAWAGKVIPAGTPVKWDGSTKKVTIPTAEELSTAASTALASSTYTSAAEGAKLAFEAIVNGCLQDDVVIPAAADQATDFVATATVVYRGAIYEWSRSANEVKAIKAACPNIVIVN
ncbi:MAG: hypothetical protein LIP09_14240 [Bacteroidales bacterium]|nr:hypothetical protein [Bacteroidales bacterium]MCC8119888.1 hypothetical protein [Bacteroidales bacterium]